jgi:hypothetical protein
VGWLAVRLGAEWKADHPGAAARQAELQGVNGACEEDLGVGWGSWPGSFGGSGMGVCCWDTGMHSFKSSHALAA